ncbi:MAG: alpha/beta hydrolase [Pseudomonadota bacterium]|nr:alpha/beta hydrolase [Pseudomonadota bacterium]
MAVPPIDRRARPEGAAFSRWRAPDGWALRRMDWSQPQGSGVRGTLLFLGGRGDFVEKYLEPLGHWHGRGWNVVSVDWRGQGDSRGEIVGGHLGSLDPLVADLAALLAELRRAGRGPLAAVGHSMGGHVLLRALAEEQAAPEAAVLVAPMLAINAAPLPHWAARWTASLLSLLGWGCQPAWRVPDLPPPAGSRRQRYLTGSPERYEDELWWWEREPGFNLGAPSWGWLEAAYRSCAQLSEAKLRRVRTPLLLVGTEADRLVSPAAIRRAAAALPNARLKMFDHAAHEILREADEVRTEALEAIDRFLDEAAPTA